MSTTPEKDKKSSVPEKSMAVSLTFDDLRILIALLYSEKTTKKRDLVGAKSAKTPAGQYLKRLKKTTKKIQNAILSAPKKGLIP